MTTDRTLYITLGIRLDVGNATDHEAQALIDRIVDDVNETGYVQTVGVVPRLST